MSESRYSNSNIKAKHADLWGETKKNITLLFSQVCYNKKKHT